MSRLRAYYAALAATLATPLTGPLRTLRYDDQDATFFTYAGTWYQVNGSWPGGSYLNTVTYRAGVVSSEPLPTCTTKVIPFSGDPNEGIDFLGASEDGGPFLFFIRALDSKTNSGWVQFGAPVGTFTYLYQWKAGNAPTDPAEDSSYYYNNFQGQSYYDHLYTGVIQLRGLPAGRYQFQIQKPANTNDPNDNGNKAFYFDGVTVYTCYLNFS